MLKVTAVVPTVLVLVTRLQPMEVNYNLLISCRRRTNQFTLIVNLDIILLCYYVFFFKYCCYWTISIKRKNYVHRTWLQMDLFI